VPAQASLASISTSTAAATSTALRASTSRCTENRSSTSATISALVIADQSVSTGDSSVDNHGWYVNHNDRLGGCHEDLAEGPALVFVQWHDTVDVAVGIG
jgi:hypothetical protein